MKSDTVRKTPAWLTPLLLQALGGTFEIGVKLDELPIFHAKNPAANGVVTLGTIAGLEVRDNTLRINFLDADDDTGRHELARDTGGYRVTHYFVFGMRQPDGVQAQRQIIEVIGVNRRDVFVSDAEAGLTCSFLYESSGTPATMVNEKVGIDARFVGDTEQTILRLQDGTVQPLDNLIVLAFSPKQGILIARDRDGTLYTQMADKLLANPTIFDKPQLWTKVAGVKDDEKVFRMGRVLNRGTEIIATISLTDGVDEEPKHGVMVMDSMTKAAQIHVDVTGEVTEFLMTATDGNGFMAYANGSLARLTPDQIPGIYEPYAIAAQLQV